MIVELAEKKSKRFAFVASADQAHRHKKSGPYGFSKAAERFDRLVLDALYRNRIDAIMRFRPKLVDASRADSWWQMVMLAGVADIVDMKAHINSYDVPTYFGMICASFQRTC